MKKFLKFGLISVLCLLGTLCIASKSYSNESAEFRILELTKLSSPVAQVSNNNVAQESDIFAVNNVYFETVVQNYNWTFPSISGSPIQEITTRITNRTQTSICFAFPEPSVPPRLEVIAPDGSSLKMQIDPAIFPPLNTPPLGIFIQPDENKLFTVRTSILELPNDRLALVGILNSSNGRWFIDLPEPGTYKVRLSYANNAPLGFCNLAASTDANLDPLWTGLAEPPFVEIQIIRSSL